ncbi:amidase signature enzyme [Panus rudis PR-1116 ss-1]|nr:amidase signature enzyme [Panus rudis PR-1116 ss-1]
MLARSRCRLLLRNNPQLRKYATTADRKAAISNKNDSVNAVVFTAPSSDQPVASGSLQGLSVGVKDNICTSDMPTTCSSLMLRDFHSPFDATVVNLLRSAGANIVGKTNCDEFGMGSLNIYSHHGVVVNPHQPPNDDKPWTARERRSAGGSSGGSAAAVASGMCDVALGTDTGGSIRLPASYCGVVGLKPSYGLLSRWGVVSYADSLDCVGVMGREVQQVRDVFDVLSQYDHRDPSAAKPETRQKASTACLESMQEWSGSSLHGLRIGVPQEYFPAELKDEFVTPVRNAIDSLRSRGATIVPVSLPSTRYALSAYYVIASAEASSNMARYDGIEYGFRAEVPPGADKTKTSNVYAHTRSRGFGKEVQKRIILGTYALTADAFDNYFLQAQRLRKLVRSDFDRVFRVSNPLSQNSIAFNEDGVHVLLHPSAIRTAPPLEDKPPSSSDNNAGLDAYVQDVLTVPASLAGLPAISVPAGLAEDGWPVGISVVSQWGCDQMVLEVGKAIQESLS